MVAARQIQQASRQLLWVAALLLATSGCAATTTAWIETSMNSFGSSFQPQNYNVTAHVGIELKRG